MDFATAAERMAGSFTLLEKELAQQLATSEYLDEQSHEVYLRAPVLRLDTSLERANELHNAKAEGSLRRLILYCDTLEIPAGNTYVGYEDAGHDFDLRVFTRTFHCQQNPNGSIQMHFSEDTQLELYTHALPPNFKVTFLFSDATRIEKTLSVDNGMWGVQVNWIPGPDATDGTYRFHVKQHGVAVLDMSTASYLDRIDEDGTLAPNRFVNDNLARLVYHEFLVAASAMHVDRVLALDVLNWVCNLTASQATLPLNIQASALRNSLILSSKLNVSNVPSVNIRASKQVLKSRLLAAKGFEEAFQNFAGEGRLSSALRVQAANLLSKSDDAMSEYLFLEGLAARAYENATSANNTAQERFAGNETSLKNLENVFKEGIDDWVFVQKVKAVGSVIWACVGLIGAVVTAVTSGGAAAVAVPAAAEEAVEAGSKVATLIRTLKEVFVKIKRLYDRLKPVIIKLKKLSDAIGKAVKAVRNPDRLARETALQRPDMNTDIYNATALWDNFRLAVDNMERALVDVDCEGKTEYFLALRTLVVNGKTFLQTQENLCQRGNNLTLVFLRVKLQKDDQVRLKKSLSCSQQQDGVLNLLKLAMFDRILAIRSLVFVDFQTYAEAYMFHSLTAHPPISPSPVKPVVDYLEDAARLQGHVIAFGSRVMVQQRQFTIHTLGAAADATELRQTLVHDGMVTVILNPDHEAFRGFSRIRVARVRCYLDGAGLRHDGSMSAHTRDTLCLHLRTSGRFYDIDLPTGYRSDHDSTEPTYKAFVRDARTVLFEYNPTDLSIICDGEYANDVDCTRQTPFTDWEIALAPRGPGAEQLDLDGLIGLKIQFWCEVTLTDT